MTATGIMVAGYATATAPVGPSGQHRLLIQGIATLTGHVRRHGALPDSPGDRIRAAVAASGLTGRGGAGFPTHRKLEAVAAGRRAVVIGNAAEGEPASAKDRMLLIHAPHLVLDGLQLAARAVGARRAHLYLPEPAISPVSAALAERRRDRLAVTVHMASDRFVAGEESAVVSAVDGGPAIPRDTPVRVVERGVGGRPTLVQNVETLAHLALIARYGAGWFREQGTDAEPGTFLSTISGPVRTPGVYEVPYGIRLADLIAAAGGVTEPIQAVLVGGYHGAWVPASADLRISRAELARYGATPGAGIVMPLGAGTCGLAASARILAYLAGESAGRCGPCVNGLPRLSDTFTALARRAPYPHLATEVDRLCALVSGRGACKHPDGTVRFIRSSMRMFAPEVSAHLAGWCTAGPSAGPAAGPSMNGARR